MLKVGPSASGFEFRFDLVNAGITSSLNLSYRRYDNIANCNGSGTLLTNTFTFTYWYVLSQFLYVALSVRVGYTMGHYPCNLLGLVSSQFKKRAS